MRNTSHVLSILAIRLALGFTAQYCESATPPNIVSIFMDDQRYCDLGCFGASEVKTPRIGTMVNEGTLFTDSYTAAPICSPSCADSDPGNHTDELTIAQLFVENVSPPREDGKTVIPPQAINSLDEKFDITYARYGDRTLELDLFRPKSDRGELPAIVCIHGGGWGKGSKINHRKVAQALAAHGFVTVSIDYRLSGEAPFPAQIQDCKAAVRFLRANAKQFGIDPANIGAIGHSAGGHLAALLATSDGVAELEGGGGHADFSSTIQAVVPMGGQTDLLSQRTRDVSSDEKRGGIWRQFLGGSLDDKPANYRLASPLVHLDKTDPPCWFITGEKDDLSTRADDFRMRMKEYGLPEGLTVIKDAPHPFTVKQIWFDEMIEAAVPFFTKHLKAQNSKLVR